MPKQLISRSLSLTLLTTVLAAVAPLAVADQAAVSAPTGRYVNDPGHTRLLWKIPHMGLSNYTARMNDVAIELDFNAEDFSKSTVRATIDPRSVDTGYEGDRDFDEEISDDPRFFNAAEHGEISFRSTAVKITGDTTAEISGELTLLGVTLPVTLDATLIGSLAEHPFVKVPALGFSATGSFDRTAFGLSYLSGVALGDVVEIEIQAEFIKQ